MLDTEYNDKARREATEAAITHCAMLNLKNKAKNTLLVIVNMREPSYRKRLYVYDMASKTHIRNHHCSHGTSSSDPRNKSLAVRFSNTPNSHMTSLGAMMTEDVYYGRHGRSLRLIGLEKGKNDNVYRRDIVIHSASYVTDKYIRVTGRCGCSFGCFAVDPAISNSLIDLIKEGTLLYCYY